MVQQILTDVSLHIFYFYRVWFLIKSHIYDFNSTYSIELGASSKKALLYKQKWFLKNWYLYYKIKCNVSRETYR